jgi:hypothetical protein
MSERTLFIGVYMEGSGNNKAIGIFNPTNEPVEIGSEATGYMLVGTDASDTEGDVRGYFPANATIPPYQMYTICHSGMPSTYRWICDQMGTTTAHVKFDGDDAICLVRRTDASSLKEPAPQGNVGNLFNSSITTRIDCVGDLGTDPGSYFPVCCRRALYDHDMDLQCAGKYDDYSQPFASPTYSSCTPTHYSVEPGTWSPGHSGCDNSVEGTKDHTLARQPWVMAGSQDQVWANSTYGDGSGRWYDNVTDYSDCTDYTITGTCTTTPRIPPFGGAASDAVCRWSILPNNDISPWDPTSPAYLPTSFLGKVPMPSPPPPLLPPSSPPTLPAPSPPPPSPPSSTTMSPSSPTLSTPSNPSLPSTVPSTTAPSSTPPLLNTGSSALNDGEDSSAAQSANGNHIALGVCGGIALLFLGALFFSVFKTSMGMPGVTAVAQQQVAITTPSGTFDDKM